MRISKWFTRKEIECNCGCGFDSMDAETLRVCDEVRDLVGRSITPSSGCRCESWNKEEGGGKFSQHLKARAMDLPVANPQYVYDYLCEKYPNKYGFGLYSWGIHIDTRSDRKARWNFI